MILADKIIDLRKKSGWSQEELAAQLNVSRQAVSKWESAQSVPDLERVLQMSRLFGVSTDYLLKDEQAAADYTGEELPADALRRVSLEEAGAFLAAREASARPMALGVALCILSPLCLMLLAAQSGEPHAALSENAACAIGVCVLLLLVAAAVALFLWCDARTKPFASLEKEVFETSYGVDGMVTERRAQLQPMVLRYQILGVVLCILGAVPLMLGALLGLDGFLLTAMVGVLLAMVALGTALFVLAGMRAGACDILLQQGDYSREIKSDRRTARLAAIYWPAVTAAYLAYSFLTGDWGRSWIVWPVAAVSFAALRAAFGCRP